MRFIALVKATPGTEAGVLPSEQQLADMGRFNEELVRAGILLAAEGLQASSAGARIQYGDGERTVVDGPFAETKELVAGFWILQARSLAEAVEWIRRAPMEPGMEVEIRQVFEAPDFGEAFTPELREAEERLAAQMAENARR
jgi:hypothetical protein